MTNGLLRFTHKYKLLLEKGGPPMFTSSIKSQGVNTSQSSKSTKTLEISKKSKTSFEDFMSSSSKDKNKVAEDEMSTKETSAEPTDKVKPRKNEEVLEKVKNLAKSLLEPQKDQETISKDDIAVSESLLSLMVILQTNIAQALNISDDTLNQAMEELGFESTDLLNVDNLKELVLFINDSQDVADLLTDENLGNSLQDLLQMVDQFKDENGLTEDKLASLLQKTQTDNLPAEETIQPNSKEINNQEPKVIVVREETSNTSEDTMNDDDDLSNNNSSTNSKNDTSTLTPTEAFVHNLVATPLGDVGFTEQIANVRQMQEITEQIVEKIKITINPSQTSMELQLNPENLGRVNLSVIYKEGVMTAHFTAQNEAVKEALESQMQTLKDNFNAQGLKVEAIEVTVSNFGFEDQSSSNTGKESNQPGRNNRTFRGIDEFPTNEEVEDISLGILDETTNSVDFIA